MKKIILLIIIFAIAFVGHSILKETPPDKIIEKIPEIAKNIPDSKEVQPKINRLKRIFNAETEIRQKMASPGWTQLENIPLVMQQAIISVEDHRFYQHGAFDASGIIRAFLVNLQAGEISEGGSTITQQLAKNLFLSHDQTMSRKIEEAIYSVIIESNFSKEEILETYLNTIYFGSGAYGIKDASRLYFKKLPQDLSIAESTMLAGIPAAPSVYSPLKNPDMAKKRQAIVLETMVKNGFIGPKKAQEVMQEKLL